MQKNNNIVAILQARMQSKRLPKKVLMEVNEVPLLKYQVDRIKRSRLIQKIVIATSTIDSDDEIEKFCKINQIDYFRGSHEDVLKRYYDCAKKFQVDTIVRLIPGVLGNSNSLTEETFEGNLLEYPQYTKPQKWEEKEAPEVLLKGDHAKIKDWRLTQSEDITRRRRPDLWKKYKKKK